MPNYNFREDLLISTKTESEIADILTQKYKPLIVEFCRDNRYDIQMKIRWATVSFEIKEDFTCERTGNVGLEFSCRGKPSGIEVSQADYYIYRIHTPKGIFDYIFKTSILKDKIKNREYFRIVNGGDPNSNSMNYLFKYNRFIKDGKLINKSIDKKQ